MRTLAGLDALVLHLVPIQDVLGVKGAQTDVALERLLLLVERLHVPVQGRCAGVRFRTQCALEWPLASMLYADVVLQPLVAVERLVTFVAFEFALGFVHFNMAFVVISSGEFLRTNVAFERFVRRMSCFVFLQVVIGFEEAAAPCALEYFRFFGQLLLGLRSSLFSTMEMIKLMVRIQRFGCLPLYFRFIVIFFKFLCGIRWLLLLKIRITVVSVGVI